MAEPVTSSTVSVEVNGEQIEFDVPARRLLVHFLRDDLGLTGTHIGCDTGNCGACTVHVDGEAVKSCMLLAVQADGHEDRHGRRACRRRRADRAPAGVQRAPRAPVRLLHAGDADERDRAARATNPRPSEEDVRVAIQGNICRCTGYVNIVEAVVAAGGKS